jgi:hypothetical protein
MMALDGFVAWLGLFYSGEDAAMCDFIFAAIGRE